MVQRVNGNRTASATPAKGGYAASHKADGTKGGASASEKSQKVDKGEPHGKTERADHPDKAGKADRRGGPVMFELPPPPAKGEAQVPVPRAIEANPEYQAAMATIRDNGILTGKLRKQLNRLLAAADPAEPAPPPSAFAAGGAAPAAPKPPDKAGNLLLNLVKHLAGRHINQAYGTACLVGCQKFFTAVKQAKRYRRPICSSFKLQRFAG